MIRSTRRPGSSSPPGTSAATSSSTGGAPRRASEETYQNLTWEQPEDGELWDRLLSLPERERTVLYLYYYQGYTALETARLMGANPSTVRCWLFRAREKLKKLLEVDQNG